MRLLPLVQYRDFRNEDGSYDEDVVPNVENYNQLVKKHNQKEYKKLIEKYLSHDKNIHFPHLIEELKNYKYEKKELFCEKVKPIIWTNKVLRGETKYSLSDNKKEVQDGLGNYFDNSSLSTENYNAEPFMKQQGFAYYRSENSCPVWDITRIGCLIYSPETVKQITPDIQHIITPSKNYFLFKLSK